MLRDNAQLMSHDKSSAMQFAVLLFNLMNSPVVYKKKEKKEQGSQGGSTNFSS